jgi:tetratricopeptide (TPR) repeat protein
MPLKPDDEQKLSLLYADHNYAAALDVLQNLEKTYSEGFFRGAYYQHMAQCYSKVGDYNKTDECIKISRRENSNNLSLRAFEIESLMQRGDLEKAEVNLVSLIDDFQIDGNNRRFFHPFVLIAKFFKITGDYEEARKYLLMAKKIPDTRSEIISHNITFINRELSAPHINRTAGLVDYINHLKRMKHINPASENQTLAISFLERRIQQEKKPALLLACHTLASLCYFDTNNLTMAKSHIDRALTIDSEDSRANGSMILYHLAQQDVVSAREHFSAATISILRNREISSSLIRHFRNAGDTETANHILELQQSRKRNQYTSSTPTDVDSLKNGK